MAYEFELAGRIAEVAPVYGRRGFALEIDGRRVEAELGPEADASGEVELAIDGTRRRLLVARRGDVVHLQLGGRAFAVAFVDSLRRVARAADPDPTHDRIVAPMPGVVVEVAVAPGDLVEQGQLLLAIESMKLQTALRAPRAARVIELPYALGQSCERGAVLVRLEDAGEAGGAGEGAA